MRRLFLDLVEARQERVHVRQRWRDQHPNLLACRPQRLRERQAAAEGVPIGVLVSEDQDLFVGVDELLDLVVNVVPRAWVGYDVSSSSALMELTSAPSDPGGSTSLSS